MRWKQQLSSLASKALIVDTIDDLRKHIVTPSDTRGRRFAASAPLECEHEGSADSARQLDSKLLHF